MTTGRVDNIKLENQAGFLTTTKNVKLFLLCFAPFEAYVENRLAV